MPDTKFLFQNYLNESRDSLFKAMNVHEQDAHEGKQCVNERVNAVAWLCHTLGLGVDNLQGIGELLSEYDRHHHQHNHAVSEVRDSNGH